MLKNLIYPLHRFIAKSEKMNSFRSFWNSPTGLKTTHFWGPTFNWSLPLAVEFYSPLLLY